MRSPDGPFTHASAPGALPLLGHLFPLQQRPLEFLTSLSEHADLVEIRLGPRRAQLVCHPDLAHQVLVDAHTFDKGGWLYDKLRVLVGDGLVTSERETHARQRRLIQPAFRSSHTLSVERETAAVTSAWKPGEPIDVSDAMHRLVTMITARALFGTEISGTALQTMLEWLPVFLRGVYLRTMSPVPILERLPTPGNRRYALACTQLHSVIDQVINDHLCSASTNNGLLSLLLTADERLTDKEIHEQVMAMLLASTEEVAIALSWTFHLIARHTEAERRLHEELDEVLAGRPPCGDDLDKLPYTRNLITEALRIYPPVWLFTRVTTTQTTLAGRSLPTGTTILLSPYVLHRNPTYFPEPDRFDPDRWTDPAGASHNRHALLPFGAGNRKCIGDTHAMTWMTLALATIASTWRLTPAPEPQIRPIARTTLSTGPLPMTPHPRR